MRILVLTNLYPPHFLGGYELLCRDVTEALLARGHEVSVLTSTHGGPAPDGGYPVLRTLELTRPLDEAPRASLLRRLRLTQANALRAGQVLSEVQPDVVFAWNQNRLTLGPLYEAQARGVPTALTFNDEHPRQFAPAAVTSLRRVARRTLERLEERLTFERLDLRHATCISEALRRSLAGHGLPAETLRVIYQGVPLDRFSPRAEPEAGLQEPPLLLFAGGLHEDKGADHVIAAVGRLAMAGQTVALDIVGGGAPEDEARLRALADERCPAGAVRFRGRAAREDMPAIYRAADAFVFPSVWEEPFGLTHLEAMASGLPVIATATGGCAEFLRDAENALVVPPRSPAAIADAVACLLRSPGLRRHLIAGGLATVRARFDLRRYVDDLEALLVEACRAGAPVSAA